MPLIERAQTVGSGRVWVWTAKGRKDFRFGRVEFASALTAQLGPPRVGV